MKKTICLLILFVANHAVAQLKVEELTNDSLVKVFISQQTGRGVQDIHLPLIKDLKEKKLLTDISMFDSIQTVQTIVDDFNNDGKLDLVVSYVGEIVMQKYYFDFKIVVFVSDESGKYHVKDLWQQYEHLLGRIIKLDTESKSFVVARHWIEFRKEVLKFDTLYYYQGEFINKNSSSSKSFDSIQYYTTSNWVASSSRYSYFTVFQSGMVRREDFDMGNKKVYQCKMNRDVFDSLNNLICAVNLWNLNDRYELINVSDVGTSHLVINHLGEVKKIDDYGHWGNFGLGALYAMIRRLNKELNWVLVEQITKKDEKKMPGEH